MDPTEQPSNSNELDPELRELVSHVGFPGFIADYVLVKHPHYAAGGLVGGGELRSFGTACASAAELIATSVAKGEWSADSDAVTQQEFLGHLALWKERQPGQSQVEQATR